jgi:hypothetical protein
VNPDEQYLSALTAASGLRDETARFVRIGGLQQHPDAKRHLLFGVGRRLVLINRSLVHLLKLPLIGGKRHLKSDERRDLDLYLNSFYFHLRGLLDNLAWGLAYGLSMYGGVDEQNENDRRRVGMFVPGFAKKLGPNLRELADTIEKSRGWHRELKELRDPIAHRIPIYCVPSMLTREDAVRYKRLLAAWHDAFMKGDFDEADRHYSESENVGRFVPVFHSDNTGQLYDIWGRVLFDIDHVVAILRCVPDTFNSTD